MPFSCMNGNAVVFADDYSISEWEDLKLQVIRGTLNLSMPCCNARASLRSGKLRRQHFAHLPGENCISDTWSDYTGRKYKRKGEKSESIDHQRVKEIIREVAIKSGWGASCEVEGATPSGNRWIADVIAAKDKFKIAFEIQISPQQFSYYRIRQQRYRESDIKCIWLSNSMPIISDKEIPVFGLSKMKGVFVVDFPSFIDPGDLKLPPEVKGVSLGEFVQLILERRVLWGQEWVNKHDSLASLEDWQRTAKPSTEECTDFSTSLVDQPAKYSGVKEKQNVSILAGWTAPKDSSQNTPVSFGFKRPLKFDPANHRYMVVFFNANSAPIENHPWYRGELQACRLIINAELPKFPLGTYAEVRNTITSEVILKVDNLQGTSR